MIRGLGGVPNWKATAIPIGRTMQSTQKMYARLIEGTAGVQMVGGDDITPPTTHGTATATVAAGVAPKKRGRGRPPAASKTADHSSDGDKNGDGLGDIKRENDGSESNGDVVNGDGEKINGGTNGSACVDGGNEKKKRGRGRPPAKGKNAKNGLKVPTTPNANGFTPINATPNSTTANEADDEGEDDEEEDEEGGDTKRIKTEEEVGEGEFAEAMDAREESVELDVGEENPFSAV